MTKVTKISAAQAPDKAASKISIAAALLRRSEGATIEQLMRATSWQAHSMRGAMSGHLKKKRGLTITSTKADGVRVYRIPGDES